MRDATRLVKNEGLHENCTGLLVAVSGGPDSMALLSWYAAQNLPFPLLAAHVNHGLRPESAQEETLVADYCHALGIPCRIFRTKVRDSLEKGETVESAARRIRYGFFRTLAQETGYSHLATAHTKDDQCETVLLHLIHGAGPKGLSGIAPKRREGSVTLIRPFLEVPKAEILAYCKENSIPYALDQSNEDLSYTRNRIRHRILPEMEKINPNLSAALCRTAKTMRELQIRTEGEATAFLQTCGDDIPLSALKTLPKPVQGEVLRQTFAREGKQLSAQQTEEALALLEKDTGTVEFDRKYRLHLAGGRLTVYQTTPPLPEMTITAEETLLPDRRILRLQKTRSDGKTPLLPAVLPLTLRPPKAGDKIKTPGGTKSLKKRMGELKIPLSRRDRLWVLTDGTALFWCEAVGYHPEFFPKKGEYGYFVSLSEQ